MPFTDFLKKKDNKPKEKPLTEEKVSPKKDPTNRLKKSDAFKILKEPHISEKSTMLTENNRYTFKVYSNTNKKQIKRAVEDVYRVKVLDVKIINIPSKKRRLGRIEGVRSGHKKAVVRIKEGQKIEII